MDTRYAVELITPDEKVVRIQVAANETIWDAAARAGFELPHTCLQGWCLSCAGKVLQGEFDQSQALRYFGADRKARFILLCTAQPRGDLRILTHQKAAMQRHRVHSGLPAPRG
ncbi:MAG: 2Fe-2S iron-sulfur cluster-binding protein [Acidobacteriota bacterium]